MKRKRERDRERKTKGENRAQEHNKDETEGVQNKKARLRERGRKIDLESAGFV